MRTAACTDRDDECGDEKDECARPNHDRSTPETRHDLAERHHDPGGETEHRRGATPVPSTTPRSAYPMCNTSVRVPDVPRQQHVTLTAEHVREPHPP